MSTENAAGTALVNVREELRKQAEAVGKRIQSPSGGFIRVSQDKKFTLPNGTKGEGPLSLVVVEFVSTNRFFDRPYKEGDKTVPACFAIGDNPLTLVPEETSPVPQAEACNVCPNNEFGSKGKGKACSNNRLLAVVENNADPESPILLLKVSATATRAWDEYVAAIKSQFESMPISVITDVYFDPKNTYPSLRFGNPRTNPNLEVHFGRMKAAKERLMVVQDVSEYEPLPQPKNRKK